MVLPPLPKAQCLRTAPAPFAVSLPPDSFVAARTLDSAGLTESEYF